MKKKVLVGLSGGVDSAIACYLLQKEGYLVDALYMRNWDSLANNDYLGNPTITNDQCPQEKDYDDALATANALGVTLFRCDFVDEYWKFVFEDFIKYYQKGMTPNPDVFCNKYIKFDAFLKYALDHGYDFIAMGHYAKKVTNSDGSFSLVRPLDLDKDQTYFLSQISQEQLRYALFPLGDTLKSSVRKLASDLHLDIATKKDSTGVCFIGERFFKKFLMNYIESTKGDIIDIVSGQKLGTHDGINFYTIGQSKGLGVGGIKNIDSKGWVVFRKDIENNILYVAPKHLKEYLIVDQVLVTNLNWINEEPITNHEYFAQFRYRQTPIRLKIKTINKDEMILESIDQFVAVTPGQIAVIYDNDRVVGSGIIQKTFKNGILIN